MYVAFGIVDMAINVSHRSLLCQLPWQMQWCRQVCAQHRLRGTDISFEKVLALPESQTRDLPGPRGAQYSPVLLISSRLAQSLKLFAASSGVTAPPSSQYLSNPTPLVISVRIKPGCTILIMTSSFFKSKLSNLPTMFKAALLAWWP
jgi:hypothetical protein